MYLHEQLSSSTSIESHVDLGFHTQISCQHTKAGWEGPMRWWGEDKKGYLNRNISAGDDFLNQNEFEECPTF